MLQVAILLLKGKQKEKYFSHAYLMLMMRDEVRDMRDNIRMLLDTSERINSKTVSLTRCQLLALLAYFVDGLQYREMKAVLRISDGKLISNLNRLEEMGLIEKSATKLGRKKLTVYSLTPEGKKTASKIARWMNLVQKVIKVSEKKCQAISIE